VRQHFDKIAWVNFGQQPNLAKGQSMLYQQLTGNELTSGMSEEEALQTMRLAMASVRLLLVLDDIWDVR
jgi:hypothetical protein